MNKYALCIGINDYPGAPLSGCINDATDWGNVLQGRGYAVEYLTDSRATLEAIIESLRSLVGNAKYGDRVVFTYSGHGTYGPDASGDEADRRDEAICPWDYATVGMLWDDEIGAILGSRKYGVRLLQVSDSCHSGSVSRFVDLGAGRPRFLPPEAMPHREPTVRAKGVVQFPNLLMAGCKDSEYSYDAWFGQRPNGAFTRAAIDALAHEPKTYNQWQSMIRAALPSDQYPQTPLLEGGWYRRRWAPLA